MKGTTARGRAKPGNTNLNSAQVVKLSNTRILVFTIIAFAFYYGYSFLSTGIYQDEEIGHYFNMRKFWSDPNAIVSPWAKFGYKLLYVLPALLGSKALVLFNCAVAVFGCYLVYKTAEKIGLRHAIFAFVLLATQYFWVELSFRNYADLFGGVVLLTAVYFHYSGKYIWSALFLSYAAVVRQEFNVLIIFYALYLLYNKKFIPVILLGLFPAIYAAWGAIISDDLLWYFHSANDFVARQSGAYKHEGISYYPSLSVTVFGAMQVTLAILGLLELLLETPVFSKFNLSKSNGSENKKYLFVIIPMLAFLGIHVFMSIDAEWMTFGASGSMRFMTSIAPLVAITGAIALDRLDDFVKKSWLFFAMLIYALIAGIFLTYKYNGSKLDEEVRDFIPLIITLGTILVTFLPITYKQRFNALIIASLVFCLLVIRPLKPKPEMDTMKAATNFVLNNNLIKPGKQVLVNHTYFDYFYEKRLNKIAENTAKLDTINALKAPVGSILIWDTHYGYKNYWAGTVQMDWYQKKGKFNLIKDFTANDQRFQAVIMEKVKE